MSKHRVSLQTDNAWGLRTESCEWGTHRPAAIRDGGANDEVDDNHDKEENFSNQICGNE